MAKNVYYDRDGNKQEEIRKARGNPNRNNHTKKKNANYGGYDAAPKAKAPAAREKPRLVLTKTQKTTFFVVLAVLVVLLVLQFAVFPESTILPIITTLILGLTCGMLYMFRHTAPLEHTTSFKIIQAALAVIAVAYTVFGAMGIMSFFGVIGG